MILTVPTGPCLAKNRPSDSSLMLWGRFAYALSHHLHFIEGGYPYDEEVGRLLVSLVDQHSTELLTSESLNCDRP